MIILISIFTSLPKVLVNHLEYRTDLPPFVGMNPVNMHTCASEGIEVKIQTDRKKYFSNQRMTTTSYMANRSDLTCDVNVYAVLETPSGVPLFYHTIMLPYFNPSVEDFRCNPGLKIEMDIYSFKFGSAEREKANDYLFDLAEPGKYTWYILVIDDETGEMTAGDSWEFEYIKL